MSSPESSGSVDVCRARVAKVDRKNERTECVLANGSFLALPSFLANYLLVGDQISFPVTGQAANFDTEFYVAKVARRSNRRDVYQATIGYVSQPKEDKRADYYVNASVLDGRLGISTIRVSCESLRDYFYVLDRGRGWEQQRNFYELLQVPRTASPGDLRLAFKLSALELRASSRVTADARVFERAFNILGNEKLRACYDLLLHDSLTPVIFPYGGFGSITVEGGRSDKADSFFASRILSFSPDRCQRRLWAPLRHFQFYDDRAVYRDPHRKLEAWIDHLLLPNLGWDASWNQWKHLLGTKVEVSGTFVQSGAYRVRDGEWELVEREIALPSRLQVKASPGAESQIEVARTTFHRFGEHSELFDRLRAELGNAPIEAPALRRRCISEGVPADFDVSLINWRPEYEPFFFQQLLRRARTFYLFRDEFIFLLERLIVVERPQVGKAASYVFARPKDIGAFLSEYSRTTKEEIRANRKNVAERLVFVCRLVHGRNPRSWLRELKLRLGETADS